MCTRDCTGSTLAGGGIGAILGGVAFGPPGALIGLGVGAIFGTEVCHWDRDSDQFNADAKMQRRLDAISAQIAMLQAKECAEAKTDKP